MQENFLLKFQVFLFFSSINNIIFEKLEYGRLAERYTRKRNSSVLTSALFSVIQGIKMCGKEFNKAFELYDQVKVC